MDRRPVKPPTYDPTKWRLAAGENVRTQGIVVSAFSGLPYAGALFLTLPSPGPAKGGGAWLAALRRVAPITDADTADPRSATIAFTWVGLGLMGLDPVSLDSFDRPFKEGMFQEDRLRRLGDRYDDEWLNTCVPGGPKWSGNTPLDAAARAPEPGAFRAGDGRGPKDPIETPTTVHALLLLYTATREELDDWIEAVKGAIAPFGVEIVRTLPLDLGKDDKDGREGKGTIREHFGFADGISQPLPYAKGVVKLANGADAPDDDSIHRVPLGEILFGHRNGHGEIAAGPVVPDRAGGPPNDLRPYEKGEGFLDFGLNGSYMVVRELKQDVAAFWKAMDEAAERLNASSPPGAPRVDATWVADRVVGRDRDGNVLVPGGVMPRGSGGPANEFSYFDTDRLGRGCPLGSHVRRGFPRDGLAPSVGDGPTLLHAANNHRILRRGRKFGPEIADPRVDDGIDRGLLFICLNTDIGRQFEFVQQTWVLNKNFACLYDETDPLIGPKGSFTIPDEPLRRIVEVPTFVQMAGGEYFFLPSLPAIRYLEGL